MLFILVIEFGTYDNQIYTHRAQGIRYWEYTYWKNNNVDYIETIDEILILPIPSGCMKIYQQIESAIVDDLSITELLHELPQGNHDEFLTTLLIDSDIPCDDRLEAIDRFSDEAVRIRFLQQLPEGDLMQDWYLSKMLDARMISDRGFITQILQGKHSPQLMLIAAKVIGEDILIKKYAQLVFNDKIRSLLEWELLMIPVALLMGWTETGDYWSPLFQQVILSIPVLVTILFIENNILIRIMRKLGMELNSNEGTWRVIIFIITVGSVLAIISGFISPITFWIFTIQFPLLLVTSYILLYLILKVYRQELESTRTSTD